MSSDADTTRDNSRQRYFISINSPGFSFVAAKTMSCGQKSILLFEYSTKHSPQTKRMLEDQLKILQYESKIN